jgi:hypothetical protein
MKYLCIAYEEERKLNGLSKNEWEALRQETLDYVETLRKRGLLIITHASAECDRCVDDTHSEWQALGY